MWRWVRHCASSLGLERPNYIHAEAYSASEIPESEGVHILHLPEHYGRLSPILHVIPLQLLSYH